MRVLKNLQTAGLVNGRDIKLAASLKGNIVVDSPLSFGSVTVDRLYTNDLMSGINFDIWYENSFLRFKTTPQVVTAPWTIRNAVVDTMSVNQGINGMHVNQFVGNLDQFHKEHHEIYTHKCQRAQELIQETQNNRVFLSHFASAFSIKTLNPINSIYLFAFFDHNYMVINSGCETDIYTWNVQNQTYIPVSTSLTGDVNQWIHVLDPQNQLYLISNNDGSTHSNCPNSGAFIWRFNPNENRLEHVVQFGGNGDFRSMQIKPNSHALFYVIRNSDNHVIEYNLRGAIVSEWNADNTSDPPLTESVHFVPDQAQLGLALSDGKQFSVLNECNCTQRTKRCLLVQINGADLENYRDERRKKIGKSMEQLRLHLENCRQFLQSVLNEINQPTGVTFSQLVQTKIENFRTILRESNGGDEQLGIILRESNGENEPILSSSHSTQCSDAVKTSISNDETSSDVTMVSSKQTGTHTATKSQSGSQNQTIAVQIDEKFIADLIYALDDVLTTNKSFVSIAKFNLTNQGGKSLHGDGSDNVTSSANMLELFDIFYKVLQENQKKHKQENQNDTENVGSSLNTAKVKVSDSSELKRLKAHGTHETHETNQTDPKVGSIIGMFMLERSLSHTIDRMSKLVLGNDNEEENSNDNINGLLGGLLGSPHINLTNDILNTIEEERATPDCDEDKDSDDPRVGDQFGDIMFKLEPFVDQLIDKVVDEIRRRNHTVGSVHEDVIKKEKAEKMLRKNINPTLSAVDVLTIMNMMDAIDTSMNQSKSDDKLVGSGSKLVDLMDMAERILIENRENHRKDVDYYNQQDEDENSYILGSSLNRAEMRQALNDSLNLHNLFANISSEPPPMVGTLFGAYMMEKTLAHTISRAADTFLENGHHNDLDVDEDDDSDKDNLLGLESNLFDGLESPYHVNTDPLEHILGLISHAENVTQNETSSDSKLGDIMTPLADNILDKVNYEMKMRQYEQDLLGTNEDDPRVGDTFGEILSKLTPVADNILDQIVDELRRREYERGQHRDDDQYLVGSSQKDNDDDEDEDGTTSKVFSLFRKIGRNVVKVYTFGKDHLDVDSIQDAANDLKIFAIDYIKDYVADNVYNNKSYGAPEEKVGDKTPEQNQLNQDSLRKLESSKKNSEGREFIKSFFVGIMKSLTGKAVTTLSNSSNGSVFWPMIKNAVTALLEMDESSADLDEVQVKAQEGHLVFKDLIEKVDQVSEHVQKKQSESNADEMVGSTLNGTTMNDQKFHDLFKKFIPLIDLLSDKTVTKLLNRRNEKRQANVDENLKDSSAALINMESKRNEVHEEVQFKCSQNLTMEEFAQKLDEFKRQNPSMFSWMNSLGNSKDENDESPKLGAEHSKQIEATVVKIPNHSLPSHQNSEIVAIRVGSTHQLLIAVSSITEHTIKSDHDRIEVHS